jgi:hypothetical protein
MRRLLALCLVFCLVPLAGCTVIVCTSFPNCGRYVLIPGAPDVQPPLRLIPPPPFVRPPPPRQVAVVHCSGAGPAPEKPYVGPGDIAPGATAYYGLRAYDARYAEPGTNLAVKLRRQSDQLTVDFAILSTGAFDAARASAFCAGTTCYVTKWYDQTGHGDDILQAVPGQQPELDFRACGGDPAIMFSDGRNTYLSGSFPWVAGNAPWTSQVALLDVRPDDRYSPLFDYGLMDGNESLFALVEAAGNEVFSSSIYGTDDVSDVASSAPVALTIYSSGTELGGAANGLTWSKPFSGSDITSTTFNMGSSPAQPGTALTGGMGEVILYPRKLPDGVIAKLAANERAYFGF